MMLLRGNTKVLNFLSPQNGTLTHVLRDEVTKYFGS